MLTSRLLWAAWALVPVGLLTYHFGPGQRELAEDRAARLHVEAREAERAALDAQEAAYSRHLTAVEARRAAFVSPTPEAEALAREATALEHEAYSQAAERWQIAAERLGSVQGVLAGASDGPANDIRLARARALVRGGDIWGGIQELESLVATEASADSAPAAKGSVALGRQSGAGSGPTPRQVRAAREELATAYYFGARLLRLAGYPQQEWRVESGKARQNFRYLAELGRESGADEQEIARHERNVELVLNLEQASLAEIQGKALPKQSPCQGDCKFGKRESNCRGKKPAPPRNKKDARGAGGADAIPAGW